MALRAAGWRTLFLTHLDSRMAAKKRNANDGDPVCAVSTDGEDVVVDAGAE